ncbi:Phosphatidylinositol 4-kinase pik1alpha (PI4-kinase)(PtdIns-4-kinase) [Microbotryomycetes sp. JL221]|nr:Phosphatidylinositol 4-kinase pik1alpha (PI4-kinase)(PtdIns-4-kinase) [Microbotryomycetes sp. JL221]
MKRALSVAVATGSSLSSSSSSSGTGTGTGAGGSALLLSLKTYPNSIGITHYLVNRLRKFNHSDVEFYWPQLCYLVITRPTPSVALENFIIERCETNAHIAVISLWYLQASLFDLSNSTKTDQFNVCKRLFNRIQSIIFTDPPLPTKQQQQQDDETIELTSPKPKLNAVMASFVGLGIVAGAIAMPSLAETSGNMAIEQGRTLDFMPTDSNSIDDNEQDSNSESEDESTTTSQTRPRIKQTKTGSNLSTSTLQQQQQVKKSLPNYLPGDRLLPSKPMSFSNDTNHHNKMTMSSSSHTYLPTTTTTTTPSSGQKSRLWPNGSQPPLASPLLGGQRRSSLMPGASSAQGSHSTPTLTSSSSTTMTGMGSTSSTSPSRISSNANHHHSGLQLSSNREQQSSSSSSTMTTTNQIELPKLYLKRLLILESCRSQLDLLRSLQDISTRLVLVPRMARLSSLRAELTVLNHGLPRGCSLGMPTIGFESSSSSSKQNNNNKTIQQENQARIVRISPSESVVLNSADRAPFVIHVEVLENDLDFDPNRRQNFEDLRRALNSKQHEKSATNLNKMKQDLQISSYEMKRGSSLGNDNGFTNSLSSSTTSLIQPTTTLSTSTKNVVSPLPSPTLSTTATTMLKQDQSSDISTNTTRMTDETFDQIVSEPKQEMDLVEQLYGDVSIHDQFDHQPQHEQDEAEIKNRQVDEQAWSIGHQNNDSKNLNLDQKLNSTINDSKFDTTMKSISNSTMLNKSSPSMTTTTPRSIRGTISLDDYAERMRMAAIMLAQLDASQQASKGVVATGTAAAGTLVGLPVATVAGIGGVVGAGIGAVATRFVSGNSSKRIDTTTTNQITSNNTNSNSNQEIGQASQGTTVELDTTSAAQGVSAVSGHQGNLKPTIVNGTTTTNVSSSVTTATTTATQPRPRVLAASDAAAIREKIMSEMMALEEERMARMKQHGHSTLSNKFKSNSTRTTEDGEIVMKAVNKEDPSGEVFAESWKNKVERIRRASPYGHLSNWNVISVIVKTGADLRQEQFAVQLIREFGRIWNEESLPAWVCYFRILVTSERSGLIETITDTVSVHSIKKEAYARRAADGSQVFPAFTLYDHYVGTYGSPETKKFRQAQDAFCKSLASYSVICYLLQLKDRHNGNILIDKDGHLIHIDFGFILSNSPGSIGFEMAPFKLPQDYIDILGGFENEKFKQFKFLFKKLFLAARKHAERIITLVELMQKDSPLPCFNAGEQTSQQLRDRFMLSLTQTQVEEFCERLIINSATSSFTRLYELSIFCS